MNEKRKTTILAFAECNMSVVETARRLSRSRYTVNDQLRQVKDKTGLDPKKFYDLVELLKLIKNEHTGVTP